MFGGVAKAGWATIIASGLMLGGSISASAADLGGDCCGDLEERIAELEATAARKGNRKVSLKVSGWVNEAVFGWDDGTERNEYVGTNALEQSRFRFTGEAKISDKWSAGYVLEVGIQGELSNQWNQNSPGSSSLNPTSQNYGLLVRKSNWFIKSKDLGQIAVGLNGTATYHLLDDADGANTRNYADAEGPAVAMAAFALRSKGAPIGSLKWTDLMRGFNNSTPGQSGRRDVVRYDSPEFQGFVATASWGEDDLWDVALTYKKTIGDFNLLGKVGYGESTDPGLNVPVGTSSYNVGGSSCGVDSKPTEGFKCTWAGAAATVMHNPTGLFVYGGWGQQTIDSLKTGEEQDSTTWFIQPGIEKKWHPIGKTTVFGEYRHDDPGSNPGKTLDASLTFWQGGVVQNIEAAAMDVYAIYQHADGDFTDSKNKHFELDNFDMITVGALVQF